MNLSASSGSGAESIPLLSDVCKHLGLRNDPETHCAYPAWLNRCHAVARPARVTLEHQSLHCLATRHTECPVYRGEVKPSPGKEIGAQDAGRSLWRQAPRAGKGRLAAVIGGLAILVLSGGAWFWGMGGSLKLAPTLTPSATPTHVEVTATAAPATRTQTAAPTGTSTPSPTSTRRAIGTRQPTSTRPPTASPTNERG